MSPFPRCVNGNTRSWKSYFLFNFIFFIVFSSFSFLVFLELSALLFLIPVLIPLFLLLVVVLVKLIPNPVEVLHWVAPEVLLDGGGNLILHSVRQALVDIKPLKKTVLVIFRHIHVRLPVDLGFKDGERSVFGEVEVLSQHAVVKVRVVQEAERDHKPALHIMVVLHVHLVQVNECFLISFGEARGEKRMTTKCREPKIWNRRDSFGSFFICWTPYRVKLLFDS
mmetsp:Transcript_17279/g.23882  ORF Transcript_17279/g.23882 Transcript_17279/m.23882 type:complete len:224 (+) Transcript_17279:124-795(+)